MTSNVVKFPYDACRRVHSKKPRRSKNGTPEERAAKAAALEATPVGTVSVGLVQAIKTLKALQSETSDFPVKLPHDTLGQSVLNLATEHDQ